MASSISYFTICDFNYLHIAIPLANSVFKNCSNPTFSIIISDQHHWISKEDIEKIKERFFNGSDRIEILLDHEIIAESRRAHFYAKYNIIEYCTAIKPFCFNYLLKNLQNEDLIVYLDPDIYVYHDFAPLLALENKIIFLTPHTLHISTSPEEIDELREFRFMQVGVFNLGFLGLRKSDETAKFISWWEAHLEEHCKIDYSKGLFVDQKWMDLVPCLFEGVEILKQRGLNIAYWNIQNRNIKELQVYFIHFSAKSNLTKYKSLEKHLNNYNLIVNQLVQEIRETFPTLSESNEKVKTKFILAKKRNRELANREKKINRVVQKIVKTVFN